MSQQQKILIIGGSGFLSGTLARACLEAGHRTWAITRGARPLPAGIIGLRADRHDAKAFEAAVAQTGEHWDLVVDCIGFDPADARQDLAVFRQRANHLVFISTDFVYDPPRRSFPQRLDAPCLMNETYGGKKRRCELELIDADPGPMRWTILRPCHIYGPGSLLGCLPDHGRDPKLIDRLRAGEALRLAGGGHFLQQPVFAPDLARLILAIGGHPEAHGWTYPAAGPDIVESRRYYQIIADILGVELRVEELKVSDYLRDQPQSAPHLCHRVYDLTALQNDGLPLPATPLVEGLAQHVRSLLEK